MLFRSEINKAIVAIAIDDEEGQKEILDYIEIQEAQQAIEEGVQTIQQTTSIPELMSTAEIN